MRTALRFVVTAKALVRPALWFCALNLLMAVLGAQCTNPTQVPNGTYTSGDHSATANNALSAASFVISGSATATFVAGHCIELSPGFRATAGTAPTTFHAWAETAPNGLSRLPQSGSGLAQQFTWTASSPSGYNDLTDVFTIFYAGWASPQNSCYIRYNQQSNLLFLNNNAGTDWGTGVVPQNPGTLINGQCSIDANGSSVSHSTNQLTLKVSVTFNSLYAGSKDNFMIAYDQAGLNSEWQTVGTWIIPQISPVIISLAPQSTSLSGGATQTFTATVSGTTNTAVTWSVSPTGAGTISQSGLYTAPTDAMRGAKVTIIATSAADSSKYASATANLTIDFSVSTPASVEVVAGGQKVSAVSTSAVNGFSAPVSYNWSNQQLWPAGLSGSFASGGTITISAAAYTPEGTFTLTFLASSGTLSHPGAMTVTVIQTLSVYASTSPAAVPSPSPYSTTPITAVVTALVRGGKPPFTYAWSPLNQQPSYARTLSNSYSFQPSFGTYPQIYFTVADSSGQTLNTGVALPIANPSDFTATTSTVLNFVPGQFGTATVTTASLGGFNSSVSFSWANQTDWPAGLTALLPPAQSPPSTGNITVKSSSYTPAGAYWLKLNASSASPAISHQLLIPVIVSSDPDFSISAQPGTVSTGQSGTATSIVSVNGGYNGSVTLSVSGLPSGANAAFSPSMLSSSGATTLSVQTATTTAVGVYPLTITGTGTKATHITTLTLTVASSAAASMISPSAGAALQGSTATFVWSKGSGVAQYQLSVASPERTYTYILPNTGEQSSQDVPLPAPGQTLKATLSSEIGGSWQSLSYDYTTVEASLINGGVSVNQSPSSSPWYKMPNDARSHTLGPWYAYYTQSGATIPNSNVSSCQAGPTSPGARTFPAATSKATVCTGGQNCQLDSVLFNLSLAIPPNTYPGNYDLICLVSGTSVTKLGQISVYDATPVITNVQQEPSDTQGQPFYITITGRNFGPQPGGITVCSSSGDPLTPCNQTSDVSICLPIYYSNQNSAARNESCPEARWSDSSIHALVTPLNADVVGTYDVTVTSLGASLGFVSYLQSDGTYTSPTSLRKGSVSIQKPPPIKIFIVHGLGDSSSSMQPLAATLSTPGLLTSAIEVDYLFDYPNTECRYIQGDNQVNLGVDDRLASYVLANTQPGQRVVFIGHSMGGLVIRSLMARNLLGRGGVTRPKVMGFATLGTPHLGYPYLTIDQQAQNVDPAKCRVQIQQMASTIMLAPPLSTFMLNPLDLSSPTTSPLYTPSLLNGLEFATSLNPTDYQGNWFAAGGRSCSTRSRRSLLAPPGYDNPITANSCSGVNSDDVVCIESATATLEGASLQPSLTWSDPGYNYRHALQTGYFIANVLCPTSNDNAVLPLTNPPLPSLNVVGSLLNSLVNDFLRIF